MITFAMFGGQGFATVAAHLARYDSLRQVDLPTLHDLRVGEIDVLLLTNRIDLSDEHARRLITFVQRGGGLICTSGALESCHDHPELMNLLGVPSGERTMETELIVRPLNHPFVERLESRWPIADRLLRFAMPPTDATPLLESSWQMQRYPVAYTIRAGTGRVVVITISTTATTQADPRFADFMGRAVLLAGNADQPKPINVALLNASKLIMR